MATTAVNFARIENPFTQNLLHYRRANDLHLSLLEGFCRKAYIMTMNKLATVLTTVNAPYSKKLTASELAACLHNIEAAKKAAGPVSAFLGEVKPGLQEAFAQEYGITKEDLAAFAKAFSVWSGDDYPLAA